MGQVCLAVGRFEHDNAVSARILRPIERRIGQRQKPFGLHGRIAGRRNPDRRGHDQRFAQSRDSEALGPDPLAQALGNGLRRRQGRSRHDHNELLAAIACHHVEIAEIVAHPFGHFRQDGIAGRVTFSETGIIYLVQVNTEKNLALIREQCIDSLSASANL